MTDNPFYRRRNKEGIGRGGRASERRLAKTLGAKQTPASGALEGAKGDLMKGDFLMESKSTARDSLGVKYDWMVKIGKEARDRRKIPALTISFTTEGGRELPFGEWVAVPLAFFKELVDDA